MKYKCCGTCKHFKKRDHRTWCAWPFPEWMAVGLAQPFHDEGLTVGRVEPDDGVHCMAWEASDDE